MSCAPSVGGKRNGPLGREVREGRRMSRGRVSKKSSAHPWGTPPNAGMHGALGRQICLDTFFLGVLA